MNDKLLVDRVEQRLPDPTLLGDEESWTCRRLCRKMKWAEYERFGRWKWAGHGAHTMFLLSGSKWDVCRSLDGWPAWLARLIEHPDRFRLAYLIFSLWRYCFRTPRWILGDPGQQGPTNLVHLSWRVASWYSSHLSVSFCCPSQHQYSWHWSHQIFAELPHCHICLALYNQKTKVRGCLTEVYGLGDQDRI